MLNSTFCLNPRGDQPLSMRLSDSIVSGCIPVIVADALDFSVTWRFAADGSFVVRDDELSPPRVSVPLAFDWSIDYASFVVRVSESHFIDETAHVVAGLRALHRNATLLNCMRRRMLSAAQSLDFTGLYTNLGAQNAIFAASKLHERIQLGGADNSDSESDDSAALKHRKSTVRRRRRYLKSQCF